ncbi:site-specific integrase [Kitasatospora aureofaciens]|uniref:site-specific integrase n=1 Tax=Kitasatospora aureofaciens TaxID=1894 RepID=UPI001C487377|nr:site-specific integrase [Kitasatospora aureofaciens]MBV6700315.1 site-specific integrase [Kitasatospora aureofaciens]
MDPYEVLRDWLEHTPLVQRTRQDYDTEVREWIGYAGEHVWAAQPVDVARWAGQARATRSRARRVSSVRGFYTHAQTLNPTQHNPALHSLRPNVTELPPGRPPLDPPTVALLVTALDRYTGPQAQRARALGYLILGIPHLRAHQAVALDLTDLVREQHRHTLNTTLKTGGRRLIEAPPAVVLAVHDYLPHRKTRPPHSTTEAGPLLTSNTGRRLDGHTTPTAILRAVAATHPLLAGLGRAITSDALAATPSPWPLAQPAGALPDDRIIGTPTRLVLHEHDHYRGWQEAGHLVELPATPHTHRQLRELLTAHLTYLTDEVADIWFDENKPAPHTRTFQNSARLQAEHHALLAGYQVAAHDADGTLLARIDHQGRIHHGPFEAP